MYMLTNPLMKNRVLSLVLYSVVVCDVDDLVEKTHLHCRVQKEPVQVNIYNQCLWMSRKLKKILN